MISNPFSSNPICTIQLDLIVVNLTFADVLPRFHFTHFIPRPYSISSIWLHLKTRTYSHPYRKEVSNDKRKRYFQYLVFPVYWLDVCLKRSQANRRRNRKLETSNTDQAKEQDETNVHWGRNFFRRGPFFLTDLLSISGFSLTSVSRRKKVDSYRQNKSN